MDKNIPISAYGSIDLDELYKVMERFKNMPDYNQLIKRNNLLEEVLGNIVKYCTSNIQIYDDGDGQYQGEDCCVDGFEILDTSLYETRPDVITVCRSLDFSDKRKMLLFKDSMHENNFIKTNIFKEDNYEIIHSNEGIIMLDNVILPLQNRHKNSVHYELLDELLAEYKVQNTISKHTK